MFQHTLNYLTYIVEKVALWVFGGASTLSEAQRARLAQLGRRVGVKYDQARHGAHLEILWALAFGSDVPFVEGKTKKWQEMGWQGDHPSSDFRGGGFLALECLIYFAEKKPLAFQRLCFKMQGVRSDWEYPFAAAGVNITFLLTKVFDLKPSQAADHSSSAFDEVTPPASAAGRAFVAMLASGDVAESSRSAGALAASPSPSPSPSSAGAAAGEHAHVFEEIFCHTFELLDKVWLDQRADYMQFPNVLKKVEEVLTKAMLRAPKMTDDLSDLLTALM